MCRLKDYVRVWMTFVITVAFITTPLVSDSAEKQKPDLARILKEQSLDVNSDNPLQSVSTVNTPGGRVGAGLPVSYRAAVLFGVDALGRILIATDYDEDGLADICFLLTMEERLDGPWSRFIAEAKVTLRNFRLTIESIDKTYGINLAMDDMEPLPFKAKHFAETFTHYGAIEFAPLVAYPGEGSLLSAMSHDNLESWPESFWYDLNAPESLRCNCDGCINTLPATSGTACLVETADNEQCHLPPHSCGGRSPGCGPTRCRANSFEFACCGCITSGLASCRCRACLVITEPCEPSCDPP